MKRIRNTVGSLAAFILKGKFSIGKKLLLGIVVFAILPVAFIGIVAQVSLNRQLTAGLQSNAISSQSLVREQIQSYLDKALSEAVVLADTKAVYDSVLNRKVDDLKLIAFKMLSITGASVLTITDENGFVLLRAHDPDRSGDDIHSDLRIEKALVENQSSNEVAVVDDGIGVFATVPIMNWVANGTITLGYLLNRQILSEIKKNTGKHLALLKFNGKKCTMLSNSFRDSFPIDLTNLDCLADTSNGPRSFRQKIGADLFQVSLTHFIPDSGIMLMVIDPIDRWQFTLWKSEARFLFLTIIAIILVCIGGYYAIRSLTREVGKNAADAAIGKITTQVAHDIRSPLSSMQAALSYFRDLRVSDAGMGDHLNLLELSAKRLSGIADGLLQRHRGAEETKGLFSLHHVVDELMGEFQMQEQFKGIAFVKRYSSGSIELFGDSAKLQRAFGNIFKNAIEAMSGNGTITVTTDVVESRAIISIADTGPGMSPDKLSRVLQGGFTEGKHDGHGIGTQVVRQVVEEFGGKLSAESTMGKGTTFIIELPLVPQQDSQSVFTIEATNGMSIVVVDDDPSLREQWRMVLKERGYQAELFVSYEDVENRLSSSTPSTTAIVDYHFDNSERNGDDVIRYLRDKGFTHLYLCTAEYWKSTIQRLAKELNVTLCPKPLPRIEVHHHQSVPSGAATSGGEPPPTLRVGSPTQPPRRDHPDGLNVLVIDDDEGIRLSWKVKREKLGIGELQAFSSMESCEAAQLDYSTFNLAFVDRHVEGSRWELGQSIRHLKKSGVKKVVIASGDGVADIQSDPAAQSADAISREKIPKTLSPYV